MGYEREEQLYSFLHLKRGIYRVEEDGGKSRFGFVGESRVWVFEHVPHHLVLVQ